MVYNLKAVKEMVNAAFDAPGVSGMAFDLFHEIYDEVNAISGKNGRTEYVVNYANQKGQVKLIVDYVFQKNVYQYNLFAPQLQTPSAPLPKNSFEEQRLRDIRHHIEEDMKLLKDYEERLRYEDDPRQIRKFEANIQRQKIALAGYQQEAARYTATSATDEVQQNLQTLSHKLDSLSQQLAQAETRLAAGQAVIRQDIATQRQAIIAHIDQRHQSLVTEFLQNIKADQLTLITQLQKAAEQGQIERKEAKELTHQVEQLLEELVSLRQNQPDAAMWQRLLAAVEEYAGWDQKLKFTLPIVPFILDFESEVRVDVFPVLQETWRKLVAKVKETF